MSLTISLLKNRLNTFYILAFAPLLLIQYFGYIARSDLFAGLVPLYGFLLLLLKKDKMSAFSDSGRVFRFMGLMLMLASFFVYYVVALFYPQAQFYGVPNYIVYLVGLFLAFFQISALRESFTTVFLVVAAVSTSYIGEWIELYMDPFIPYFVQIIAFILRTLGIPARLVTQDTFVLQTLTGRIQYLYVVPKCIGIYSFLTFAIIIVVTMIEDTSSLRTRLVWSVAGIVGAFIVNIIRVSLIFGGIYYFGFEIWSVTHSTVGYALFILWLTVFFLIFSMRRAILSKLQTFWRKLR